MTLRRVCATLFLVLAGSMSMAQEVPEKQAILFIQFARDVSGDDPKVMEQARGLIDSPPTTLETIGFYGLEHAPAPERTLRGIISLLGDEGHILGFEDKYINEMPLYLEQESLADFAGDPLKDPLALFGEEIGYDTQPTDAQWQTFRANFGLHVRSIDAAVQRTGNELLSLDLPLGDTMYFWLATPEIAAKWRNKMLYAGVNTLGHQKWPLAIIKVTDPAWDGYWAFLTNAIGIPEPYRDVPDYE